MKGSYLFFNVFNYLYHISKNIAIIKTCIETIILQIIVIKAIII